MKCCQYARSGIHMIQTIFTAFGLFQNLRNYSQKFMPGPSIVCIFEADETNDCFSFRSVLQRLTDITFTILSGCSRLGPSKRTGFFRHLFSVCHSASVAVTTSAGPSLGKLWLDDIYPKSPLIGCRYQGGQQGPLLVSRPVGWNVTFKVLPLYM